MNDSENITNAGSVFGKDISAAAFKNYLVYLFLLGLIVRAGFLVEHARSPSFGVLTLDQKYYDSAAKMLLAGEDLHQLHGLRPLLYPMFGASLLQTRRLTRHRPGAWRRSIFRGVDGRAGGVVGGAAFPASSQRLVWRRVVHACARAALSRRRIADRVQLHFSNLLGLLLLLRAADVPRDGRGPFVAARRCIDHPDRAGAPKHPGFHGGVSALRGVALVALPSTRSA